MPAIRSGTRSLWYEDRGEGTPLLFFHPFPLSTEGLWPLLEAPPPNVRIIAPDQRGFGRSDLGDGVTTMEAMAEDALELMNALSLPAAYVGGISMGGYVALALARLDPGRVRGLILADTQSGADDAAGKERRESVARDVEQHGLQGLADSMVPKLLSDQASHELRARVEQIIVKQRPAAVAAASRGMGTRTDGKDILHRFAGPTLLLVGSEDRITPPEKAQIMKSLAQNAVMEIIEGAGHLAHLEAPEAFKRALSRFV